MALDIPWPGANHMTNTLPFLNLTLSTYNVLGTPVETNAIQYNTTVVM